MINRKGYLVNNKGKLEGYIRVFGWFYLAEWIDDWSTFEATNVNLNKPTEG